MGRRLARSHSWDTAPASNTRVRRVETPAASPAAILAGLDPGRLDPVARASALQGIGSFAGNAAVASLVSRIRADKPLGPPGGINEIRKVGGGGNLGHTRLSMDPTAPLFRLPSPESVDGGFAVRPSRTRAPELDFEVRYPTAGRHLLFEGKTEAGGRANTFMQITGDWQTKLLKGEEEHVGDQTIAWEDTWKRVADITNTMATDPPIKAATADEARRAAWRKFVGQLPGPLKPTGADASDSAQLEKWDFADTKSVFRTLIGESKRARDASQWHTPGQTLDHLEGADEVRTLEVGSSKIDVTKPEQLMLEAWKKLPGAGGRAPSRGGRGR